ncbi:MAG TPA: RNA 2',3'-cyclic phosphodiesterase [Verrucomicrobiae bacterium]|nr:RNA 2',3'-cyclic phosphodiesterase [Verrucomicrobiae bacterium]
MTPEPKAIRAFIAIRAPETVLARLAEVQRELKELLPPRSTAWTKPDNMHLTLRFLGNVAATNVPEVAIRLRNALAAFGKLDLACERLGCFPDSRYPRVVWAWVHDAHGRLQELHRCVDEAVREFAEKPAEARFVGHLTLARPKQIKRPDAERLARFVEAAVKRSFGQWSADEILLMRSELSPGGSKYHELARIRLS